MVALAAPFASPPVRRLPGSGSTRGAWPRVHVTSESAGSGPIVSTESRTQGEATLEAVGDALPEHPMVVLIDKDTASASEIFPASVPAPGGSQVGRPGNSRPGIETRAL